MNTYLMNELAHTTIDQRRREASAWRRARQARRAARQVAAKVQRPTIPAQREAEHDHRALVRSGQVHD